MSTTANIYVHMDWSDKANSAKAMEEAIEIPDFTGYKSSWEK